MTVVLFRRPDPQLRSRQDRSKDSGMSSAEQEAARCLQTHHWLITRTGAAVVRIIVVIATAANAPNEESNTDGAEGSQTYDFEVVDRFTSPKRLLLGYMKRRRIRQNRSSKERTKSDFKLTILVDKVPRYEEDDDYDAYYNTSRDASCGDCMIAVVPVGSSSQSTTEMREVKSRHFRRSANTVTLGKSKFATFAFYYLNTLAFLLLKELRTDLSFI